MVFCVKHLLTLYPIVGRIHVYMFDKETISRRDFLKGAAVTALTAGVLAHESFGTTRALAESSPSPEVIPQSPIEFGFNTHVHSVLDSEQDNMTLDLFKRSVDLLANQNQDWIRFNIRTWEVAQAGGEANSVEFNENIGVYDEAIAYAKEKGLKVFFVTNVPDFAKEYSHEDYKQVAKDFYTKLAQRYSEQVDIWQIFNEADTHAFRDYSGIGYPLDPKYLQELAEVMQVSADAIKAVDKDAKTTANLSHWVRSGVDIIEKGTTFFDAINDSIDIVSLDLYTDDSLDEINRLPSIIEYFSKRYNKHVFIAELGLPTAGFPEEIQGAAITAAIEALKSGNVRPEGVIIYELSDEATAYNAAERSFGVFNIDGSPKDSADDVFVAMQPEEEAEEVE